MAKRVLGHSMLLIAILMGGCATMVPEHTLYLGEVAHVATPEETLSGVRLGPDDFPAPTSYRENCESELLEHSKFVIVRFSYFWTRASGTIHNDASWAIAPQDLELTRGNVVELDIARSKHNSNFQCPVVKSIYFRNFELAQCEYRLNDRGVAGTIVDLSQVTIGGRGSKSIHCPGLQEAGWESLQDGPEKSRAWKKTPK